MASGERLFGTDGIRGPFGEPPLDPRTVTCLGRCLAEQLGERDDNAPRIVVGGDTRASTPQLAEWLLAGFTRAGGSGTYVGVLPTPGVAYLAKQPNVDGGVVLSASHNPAPDNGIKLFDAEGFKWGQDAEAALESALSTALEAGSPVDSPPLVTDHDLGAGYFSHLLTTLPSGRPLAGLDLVLDAANGAASPYAESLFSQLGATVFATGASPNGANINLDRGSTRPQHLIDLVRERRADLGIALDGDADRVLLVDETGWLQDGDTMLYLWARDLLEHGQLEPAAIVATTMSNLGLELALRELGIETVRCDVGDRVVVETMRRHGVVLGGEQSGHLIHLGMGSTGDGLLTALQLAFMMIDSGQPLSRLASPLERLPQVLVNVRVTRKVAFEELPGVAALAAQTEALLGDNGRLLLRYSGTEPLARVMIEGQDQGEIDALAGQLADELNETLGTPQ